MPTKFAKLACAALLACGLFLHPSAADAAVHVIYGDDCVGDVDCANNFATLNKLADRGEIVIDAVLISSCNDYSAPAAHIFMAYYGRGAVPVGAYQGACPAGSSGAMSASGWTQPLVAAFNPGDIRTNYPDSVVAARTVLTAAPDSSEVLIVTGELANIANIMRSAADGISSQTGAQLLKAKVLRLVDMGGDYPTGLENNLVGDPVDANYVFSNWTTASGYPPTWMVSFTDGENGGIAGPPSFAVASVNPMAKAMALAGATQRGTWDNLAILFAARGLASDGVTYFTDSGDGTQTVNASSGANSWSSGSASGHHYLINALSADGFAAIFDGYAHQGFAGMPPGSSGGLFLR